MSPLDLGILALLLVYALRGARRGPLRALADLAGLLLSLAVALAGYRALGALLSRGAGLPGSASDLAAFCLLTLATGALWSVLTHAALGARRTGRGGARALGALLGLVAGVGVVVAALLVGALDALPGGATLTRNSALVPSLRRASAPATRLMERALPVRGGPVLDTRATGGAAASRLSFPAGLRLRVDADSERRMLALINRDRAKEGLRPLRADAQLREVARAHSREMFRLSYFAHESPRTGTPGDRLRAARVPFLSAGENLAYQPDVATAHRRLMESPGHRKNLLSPEYGRLGIGVIEAGSYGRMIAQEFAD